MAGHLCLFLCVALVLASHCNGEYEWSGFVNSFEATIDFTCSDNQVVVGLASDFSSTPFDRRWEFQCATGGGLANVSSNCTLQPSINSLQGDISYSCPNNGYISGFVSEFTSASSDRTWQPYCCNRPFATLINCVIPTATWENVLRENLNYSAPQGYVVAGLESFFFNRDRRWRFLECEVEVDCGDPGVPLNAVREGDRFLYQDLVVFSCNHGYYQSSGPVGGVRTCLETGLWSDTQPECSLCTDIPNCADIRCTNSSDHTCFMCDSDNGDGRGEAAYRNLNTECLPLCSWLESFCYPGVCLDGPSSCNCSEGFTGPDCLEITVSSELESCSTLIRGSDGSLASSSCSLNSTSPPPIYTNVVPSELEAEWNAIFLGPSPPPTSPAYISEFSVGVATSEVQATLYRAANPTQAVTMTTHPCTGSAPSPDAPSVTLTMCSALATPSNLSSHAFLHGDTFVVQAYVLNGGFLDILNLDTNETTRNYYSGTPALGTSLYVIDLEAPTHCSLVSLTPCLTNQNLLSLGTEITSSSIVTVTWGGWVDVPSGVTSYVVNVFELVEVDDTLQESSSRIDLMMYQHTGQNTYEHVATLPNEGPYSFVLQTIDEAGSIRYSRRLVLYDATSILAIDPGSPLQVISAVPATGFLWQNSTTDPLIVSGRGHFYNTNLQTNNYLAPVANYTSAIEPEYDHPLETGRYPRGGTPNALGVTRLFYTMVIDQEGGSSEQSLTQPVVFPFESDDLGIFAVEISTDVDDGDSIRIWFQAIDFKFQEQFDSVLVHVDSSPPVLQNLWLEWDGVTGLALHGTETLLDLSIQFQAYDEHSGMATVEWWIGTEPGASDVGYGNVPIQTADESTCMPPECYCSSLGDCSITQYTFIPPPSHFPSSAEALHDTDYFITVAVTNHALLTSSLLHHITVDTTPPLPGVVFDATLGSRDLDFQQDLTVHAWWSGFFDRETDIAFYQYVFDTHCANESYFSFPLGDGSNVIETTETFASWVAIETGTYIVTVVAYNNGLQPSLPVCSDGITIDVIPPSFEGVHIPGAVVEPGLARNAEGEVWVIDGTRERRLVGVASENEVCGNRSTLLGDLSQYPIRMEGSTPATLDPALCVNYAPFDPTITYITSDFLLNISWYVSDDVGIRDFRFGIVSAINYTQDMSTVATARQTHYSIHDPTILSSGNTFFISIVAVDLALQETSLDIGPVVVDISPPVVNGSVIVAREGDHVIITWEEWTFTDPEDVNIVTEFEYAIGRSEFGSQIQQFTLVPPPTLPHCPTTYCVAIDTETTPLLSGHDYHFTIKAKNTAGLSSIVTSNTYTHVSGAPLNGVVSDIDPSLLFDITTTGISLHGNDIDLLVDRGELAASWEGFGHPHLVTSYLVGLGSQAGMDDISPFALVGQDSSRTFTGVQLVHGQWYYVTVIAQNEYGVTTVTSDGVLALQNVESTVTQYATVYDGNLDKDIDYQYSTSYASTRWVFPPRIAPYISHYQWALYRATDGNTENLVGVTSFENIGNQTAAATAALSLEEGELYVSAIQACHFTTCLPPVYSDGFRIAIAPEATHVNATYTPLEWNVDYGTSSMGVLEISWELFIDPWIAYYEWSLGTGDPGYELLIYWNEVEWSQNRISLIVNETISIHTPNVVTVKGYNTAGLYSMASTPLYWVIGGVVMPQDSVPRTPLIVIDIPESQVPTLETTDWREMEYFERDFIDLQYSNSPSSLSAVWPDLRYMRYDYSVSTTPVFQPCDSEESLACGTTITNAITISGLNLVDNQRYYVCMQAFRGDIIHQTSSTPSVLLACSNGVTVDLSVPQGGCVQILPPVLEEDGEIGSGGGPSGFLPLFEPSTECLMNGSRFQASTSDVHIIWDQFVDIEQSGYAVHVTGVAYYEFAIGTSSGATDVVDFTAVGLATEAIATGLSLYSGTTYHATIRAYDFTGQWSDAVSSGVTVDTTPPTIDQIWLEGTTQYTDSLRSFWEPVEECESEISTLEWGLGSRPGSSDLMEWTQVLEGETSGGYSRDLGVGDGQLVFLSVKAQNGAGLTSLSSSHGYILDSSPPEGGIVYDGPRPSEGVLDLDYTTSLTTLSAHWSGFADPHCDISEYYWSVGTCSGCSNVQNYQSVGVATGATRTGLTLTHGRKYYITVTGCNSVGLCTEVSSNGITVDTTPPIPARVLDGYVGKDVQFQASRSHISAHWSGFHDSESSLHHYIIFAGLRPNDSSILSPAILPASETSFLVPTPFQLPTNRTVYTTLIAYNGAGLYVQVSSDGVYIDDTPPETSSGVTIDTEWGGSAASATQYSQSVIRVNWDFADSLTAVSQHFWTLVSDPGVQMPLDGRTTGTQSYGTNTNIALSDGEHYYVLAIGCNSAGLCIREVSTSILFDSTPPIDGYFAAETNSSIELQYTVPGGMTWRNRIGRGYAELNLAFVGFSDPHSNISEFWTAVGTNYSLSDLTVGAFLLEPSVASDNGTLLALVQLERLLEPSEVIYVSLWAVNGAGLKSHVIQGSFRVDEVLDRTNNGSLTLLRSSMCQLESCQGHCTCAARGQLCSIDSAVMATCQELDAESLPTSMQLTVYDVVPQVVGNSDTSVLYTAVSDKLVGQWELSDPDSTAFQRLEWTVGEKGFPPGSGLIDTINDPVWRDAGTDYTAVFTVSSSYPLLHGRTYVFYIRAWYSTTASAVFTSDGVTVDTAGPEVAKGWRVREVSGELGDEMDIDFWSSTSDVYLSWSGVFLSTLSGNYSLVEVGLGDVPGSDSVHSFSPVAAGVTSTSLSGLALSEGRNYYSTVRAISPTSLITVSVSDGFKVDISPPNIGTVVDGLRYSDTQAQNDTSTYSARWFGFNDPESHIHHYELAITDSSLPPAESEYENMGIRLKATVPGLDLVPGKTYYAHVVAVNIAGLRSEDSISSGVIIDNSRPSGVQCDAYSSELLQNPSFEGLVGTSSSCSDSITAETATEEWTLDSTYSTVLVSNTEFIPYEGCFSLYLVGSISQVFATNPGTVYKMSFALQRYTFEGSEHLVTFQAKLTAPDIETIVQLPLQDKDGFIDAWQRFEFSFMAEDTGSSISLETLDNQYGILVDGFTVQECTVTTELIPSEIIVQWSDIIQLRQEYISGSISHISASWDIRDIESGVKEYYWAIGTIAGGEQLQHYTSTGNTDHAVSEKLYLVHGMTVYISVLSWNYAGLETVVYSDPFIVDLTPPLLEGTVRDGLIADVDIDYQNSTVIAANWEAIADPESGIADCRWAIGTSPGYTDIQTYVITTSSYGTSEDLESILTHGTTVYSTVICTNGAGLHTTAQSDGLTILLEPPSNFNAFVYISSPNLTRYEPQSGYIPSDDLALIWGGFSESAQSPLRYELRVSESGVPGEWNSVGLAKMLTLSDLQLPEGTRHTAEVRAINYAGVPSLPIQHDFKIVSSLPVDTGAMINSTWTTGNSVRLEWTGKFTSPAPIYYEVSLGTQVGSGSIQRWIELETDQTLLTVTNARLDPELDYFLALTAITSSGLHTTVNHMIAGMPITG